MNGRDKTARARIGGITLLLTLGFLVIAGRLFQIQVLEHEAFARRALAEVSGSSLIERERGPVSDRNGREMAVSLPVRSVFVDPARVAEPAATARRLAAVLGVPAAELEERIVRNAGRRFVWIARKLDGDALRRLENLKDPAVGFVPEYRRVYPFGPTAAHLLGFAGLDSVGLEGIELAYDGEIRGPPVEVEYIRDVQGNPIPRDGRVVYPHYEGRRLVLTIDLRIQAAAEKALAGAIERFGARAGAVVALDPRTGEVLAMASAPTYDPNRFGEAPAAARRNRAVTDAFEPGSVLKAFVAAALLEAGVVSPETVFHCPGEVEVAGRRIRCTDRHGRLTFREAVERSCNVGLIEATRNLPPEALHRVLETFGFGTPTGIDLPGERSGVLRPAGEWSALSRAAISIGQEVSVTTVQLAAATAALATGRTVRPHAVREVRDADGEVLRRIEPARGERLLSDEVLRIVREILRGATETGTGRAARIAGVAVAGKTGTAQVAGPGGYAEGRYNAVFTGWAPADDPAIAIAVVVQEPDPAKGYYGGVVAAPVFRAVAEAGLRVLGRGPEAVAAAVPPRAAAAAGAPRAATAAPPGRPPAGRVTATGVVLPDFRGYTMREVHESLTAYPVRPRLVGTGRAVRQDPPAGVLVPHGTTVTVRFAS